MEDRLAGGNMVIALLANTVSTGAALVALILTFGPISGAHFNPAVTLVDAWQNGVAWATVPHMIAAQVVGGFAGVAAAHLMFGEAMFPQSHHVRSGGAQIFSEFVATLGDLSLRWTQRTVTSDRKEFLRCLQPEIRFETDAKRPEADAGGECDGSRPSHAGGCLPSAIFRSSRTAGILKSR